MTTLSEEFLPFDSKSSVWADVKPIHQNDGPAPLCPILYSPDYSQAMDLLRALLPADELSPRTLALTEHLSKLCPSSYTVWFFRARILINGPEETLGNKKKRLEKELLYLNDLAKNNMKNYQVWQHRKLIVTALGDPSKELQFAAKVLQEDNKNYNTWVYRQWVLSYFGGLPNGKQSTAGTTNQDPQSPGAGQFPDLWKGELEYIKQMLQIDARNNSAWNHRYFCLFACRWALKIEEDQIAKQICSGKDSWNLGESTEKCIQNEIEFTKACIKMIPHNASAWNYLRGIVKQLPESARTKENPFNIAIDLAKSLVPTSEEAQKDPSIDTPPRTPSLALEWLLDDAEARLKIDNDDKSEIEKEAEHLVNRLIVADVIRKRYWLYRLTMIRKKAQAIQSK